MKNIATPSGIVAMLFGLQWPRGEKMASESEKGARDNHGKAIIICLHLLFYPLSPVDTANGIASLCHSKSHFCPPSPCLCWQSERMRGGGKKGGGKEPTEAFFNMAFCQFLCACQNERMCPVAMLVGELLGRGWSLSVGKVVETSNWRGTPMLRYTSRYSKESALAAQGCQVSGRQKEIINCIYSKFLTSFPKGW